MKKLISIGLIAFAAAMLPATTARGAVSLAFSDTSGSPTSVSITAGQSFTVTLSLTSTGPSVTAADYFLQIDNNGSGHFRVTNRDNTGSPISDLFKSNTGDNGANAGVLDTSASLLSPSNALDLGGSISNVNAPLGAGTYTVAQYTLTTDATLAPGTYTLSTMSLPGTGYEVGGPTFDDTAFDQHASYSITVTPAVGVGVPEPTGVALGLIGIIALAARRR